MKFKGTIVGAASGSISGITASRNRGGQYFRMRSIPTDPISAGQAARRSVFGALASRWLKDLSASERLAWNDYAANTPVSDALGDAILLSGQQQFIRTNTVALIDGGSMITSGPTIFGTGEMPVWTSLTVDPTEAVAVFETVPGDGAIFVFLSRPRNISVAYNRGPYRYGGQDTGDTVTVTALPFVYAEDQHVWAYARSLTSDGRLSGPAYIGPSEVQAA